MQHTKYLHFCPRCGKPTEYNRERNGLCLDCYLELHKQKIPKDVTINITVCSGCGEIKYGDRWYEPTKQNLDMIIRRLLRKTQLRVYDYKINNPTENLDDLYNYDAIEIPISIRKNNDEIVSKRIKIVIQHAFCPICSKKKSGKYYESIIHIRYTKTNEAKVINAINAFIDRFLSSQDKLETIDVKKEGTYALVIRYSNRKTAHQFIESLRKKFSIVILQQYKEPITLSLTKRQIRINVEKYMIRIM